MNAEPDAEGPLVTIPQASPGLRVAKYRTQIDAALARVLDGDAFILGPTVARFEVAFARYLARGRSEAMHCIGVGSGTDAIALALRALGVGPGDEVVTTALAPSGTGQGVALTGARPIFADVDSETGCLDPESVARRISGKTRAILVVHLYGLPADMNALGAVANAHGIALVEDCAHAHGASAGGGMLGTIGDAAAFSFYPTKNLGCLGDGGAVVCKDPEVAERVRGLRRYGWRPGDVVSHHIAGNSCLSEMQAAVLEALLPHLDQENEERRVAAARYDDALSGIGLALPPSDPGCGYHQYVVRHPERDRLREDLLRDHGVRTGIHYAPPLHAHPAFADPGADLPNTERLSRTVLSLPIQPDITAIHQAAIIDAVRDACLR